MSDDCWPWDVQPDIYEVWYEEGTTKKSLLVKAITKKDAIDKARKFCQNEEYGQSVKRVLYGVKET